MPGLLIDANISYRIKKLLVHQFPIIEHAASIQGHPLKDIDLWAYAKKESLIIVTHDEDFIDIQTLRGFPPKVIWLRFGNQPTIYIANKILLFEKEIKQLDTYDELGALEIY